MERAEMWFHVMLALALGTIIYVIASGARVRGAHLHQIQYPDRSTGVLIFIEDFRPEASSLPGNDSRRPGYEAATKEKARKLSLFANPL
jgi:hypothetical protein